jgi:hypothetical protein
MITKEGQQLASALFTAWCDNSNESVSTFINLTLQLIAWPDRQERKAIFQCVDDAIALERAGKQAGRSTE